MKIFPDKQKLRSLITSRCAQQELLKNVLKGSSSVQKEGAWEKEKWG